MPHGNTFNDKKLNTLVDNFGSSGDFIGSIQRRTQQLEKRRGGPAGGRPKKDTSLTGPRGGKPFNRQTVRRAPPLRAAPGPKAERPLGGLRNRPRRQIPESSSRRFIRGGF